MTFSLPSSSSSSSSLLKVPDDETTAMTMTMMLMMMINYLEILIIMIMATNDVRVITMLVMTMHCTWLQIIEFEPHQIFLFFSATSDILATDPMYVRKFSDFLGEVIENVREWKPC